MSACDGNLDLPGDRSWQSTHFNYLTRASDDALCPDVLGPLEDHFAELQGYLGFDWPAGQKVTYLKFVDAMDFQAHNICGEPAGGCALESTVESPVGLDTHELVHAYLAKTGFPPPVLLEGIAVALSCGSADYSGKPTDTWDQLAAAAYSAGDTSTVYDDGAWLVGYLLDEFGPRPFLTLYRTLRATAGSAEMDAAFRAIYGQSLAAIWAAALDESQPRNVCIWHCSRPPLALDGAPFDSAGVCGVDSARPFTLAAESTISFATTGASFSVRPCGQVNPGEGTLNGALKGGLLALYDLPASSYFLDYSSSPGTITGTADASAAVNPICADATDVAALSAGYIFLQVPSSRPNWFMPIPPPPAGAHSASASPGASVCASCDPSTCLDPSQPAAWTGARVLQMPTDPSSPFSQFWFWWF